MDMDMDVQSIAPSTMNGEEVKEYRVRVCFVLSLLLVLEFVFPLLFSPPFLPLYVFQCSIQYDAEYGCKK